MRKTNGSGFTLIELMIVVAIIGILAAVAIPKFAEMVKKSQEGSTKGNLGVIRSALSIYYSDMEGNWPNDNLDSLTVNGKYLSAIPKTRLPSLHPESSVVCVSQLVSTCRIGLGAPPGYDGQLNGYLWVYWEQDTPPMSGTPRNHGDFWLGCLHTDSKGTVWTAY